MRSAGEIKRMLCVLRFQKNIPLKRISDDSRCSIDQVKDAMKMEASETVQRRLDAYLDAGDLHKLDKETPLLIRLQRMNQELWRQYQQQSMKYEDMALLPIKQQLMLASAMNHRLKKCLRKKVESENPGFKAWLPDSENYFVSKAKIYRKAKEWASGGNDGVRTGEASKIPLKQVFNSSH